MSGLQFVITNEDVKEFRRRLEEEAKTLTPEAARASLIKSGVLDKDGKPTWPISQPKKRTRAQAQK